MALTLVRATPFCLELLFLRTRGGSLKGSLFTDFTPISETLKHEVLSFRVFKHLQGMLASVPLRSLDVVLGKVKLLLILYETLVMSGASHRLVALSGVKARLIHHLVEAGRVKALVSFGLS